MSFKLQQANKAKAEAKIYKKQKRNERKTLSRLQCHRQNGDKGNAQAPESKRKGKGKGMWKTQWQLHRVAVVVHVMHKI